MAEITRRTFLKGSAAAGGGALAGQFLFSPLGILDPLPAGKFSVDEEWIPTTCWIGKQDCGMLARRVNGRVVSLVGHPNHPRNYGKLCPKGVAQLTALYDPNRVKGPMVRTNAKGEPGTWRQVSWDEALDMVAERMADVIARDPKRLVWQKGRSKAKAFYDDAFTKAVGATKLSHGAMCSDAGYRAMEYTIGTHAVMHPDFRHTELIVAWGWSITSGGGNKTCWLTWPQELVAAKERGARVISIDPHRRGAAHFADEWIPIRPASDLALAMAVCNYLVENGVVDEAYLKTYTNSPYLVGEDGYFLRAEPEGEEEVGKPLVWDLNTNSAVPFDTEGADPALEGEFDVDGQMAKTGFTLFKEDVAGKTAEWAADICGVPAAQIEAFAQTIADNAHIGETIEIEGLTLPYRPVGIMTYHIAQQELGFQAMRAIAMINMLIGAFGAVGGTLSEYTWKIDKRYAGLDEISITDSPNIYLDKSKYYPINSANSSLVGKVLVDPDRYGVSRDKLPEMMILHMVNPLGSFPDRDANAAGLATYDFIVAIDPWLSLTADLYADVILPCSTLEKYEGPMSANNQYEDAKAMRVPVMDPVFDTMGEIEIYIELCERAGVLYGEDGYIAQMNNYIPLEGEFALPLDQKPDVRDIFDRWARANGVEEGIEFFETEGVQVKGPISAAKIYGYATDPPFLGALHRLYGESLLRYQEQMKEMGADEVYYRDYTPLPVWRENTFNQSPEEYDLTLISYHLIEFKQSRTPLPMVMELAPHQVLDINPKTAQEKGLANGDEAIVESHNALTGETRQLTVTVRYREAIRPDVVAMPHHYGDYARHPWVTGAGPTPNTLFFTGEGYVANTADQTYQVKVKVSKA